MLWLRWKTARLIHVLGTQIKLEFISNFSRAGISWSCLLNCIWKTLSMMDREWRREWGKDYAATLKTLWLEVEHKSNWNLHWLSFYSSHSFDCSDYQPAVGFMDTRWHSYSEWHFSTAHNELRGRIVSRWRSVTVCYYSQIVQRFAGNFCVMTFWTRMWINRCQLGVDLQVCFCKLILDLQRERCKNGSLKLMQMISIPAIYAGILKQIVR